MWGVKWLTNGGTEQSGGTAQPAAVAPQHRKSGDESRAAALASQQPTAHAASSSDADQGNGHAAGQHGTAGGSHTPPGADSLATLSQQTHTGLAKVCKPAKLPSVLGMPACRCACTTARGCVHDHGWHSTMLRCRRLTVTAILVCNAMLPRVRPTQQHVDSGHADAPTGPLFDMYAVEVPASEKELRAQLRELQAERDALLKDVEALCMQACPLCDASIAEACLSWHPQTRPRPPALLRCRPQLPTSDAVHIVILRLAFAAWQPEEDPSGVQSNA